MANSFHVKALLGCFALALGAPGVAQDDNTREALVFDFESVSVDQSTNEFHAVRPKITQGNLSIEADEAVGTSIDFSERTEWRFTGNVRIAADTAVIEAASAVFTFDDARLLSGELVGTPVTFSDFDEARQVTVEGRAEQMSYDYVARKLRMTGEAWVQRGRTQVLSCDLIYDFTAAERDTGFVVSAGSSDCENKFRMVVLPDPEDQPAATDAPR